jgi:hypothetical protein
MIASTVQYFIIQPDDGSSFIIQKDDSISCYPDTAKMLRVVLSPSQMVSFHVDDMLAMLTLLSKIHSMFSALNFLHEVMTFVVWFGQGEVILDMIDEESQDAASRKEGSTQICF